jgi:hypothetical protein
MSKFALSVAALSLGGIVISAQTQQSPPSNPPASAPTVMATQQTPQLPASPPGTAQTQVGGEYTKNAQGREVYQGGKWITITYSRPIKRGRDVFGSGADYGKPLLVGGATVWRAGANQSTRLNTEVPLVIGEWTLIVSSWGAKKTGRDDTPNTLWGSFNYTPDKDVARAPMAVTKLNMSLDQLTWAFADVTKDAGKIAIAWDTTLAAVPFTVGK